MAKQRLDERALPSDLSADAIMAEAERRLQSPLGGNASVPADWPPQNPRRQLSNRLAKNGIEDTAARSRMPDYKQFFPDNASLARAGRQFTVGNIGNNGRIYLRYVRPSYRRVTCSHSISLQTSYTSGHRTLKSSPVSFLLHSYQSSQHRAGYQRSATG